MSSRRHGAGVLLVWLALGVACSKPKTYAFSDTEGRTFTVTCDGPCDKPANKIQGGLAPSSRQPRATPDSIPSYVFSGRGRYVGVCDGWAYKNGSGAFDKRDCRIVKCTRDADCPHTTEIGAPVCERGLCGDPSRQTLHSDVMMLCLKGFAVQADASVEREQLVLSTCKGDGACTAPSVCAAP